MISFLLVMYTAKDYLKEKNEDASGFNLSPYSKTAEHLASSCRILNIELLNFG